MRQQEAMIPTIGVMIGCYIVTRMWQIFSRKLPAPETEVTKLLAVLTLIVACMGMVSLCAGSAESSTGLQTSDSP
jgi:hypothetical protein